MDTHIATTLVNEVMDSALGFLGLATFGDVELGFVLRLCGKVPYAFFIACGVHQR